MPQLFAARVLDTARVQDIPGRFGDAGLRELVQELGGTVADEEDVWEAVGRTFRAMPMQELSERLLDAVLLQPPIPAGCEALVHGMQDPEHPPWRTHEVAEDRVWLWYCHRLLHSALPDAFPAPTLMRIDLEVTALDDSARPPGLRTGAHDRTAFVAHLLKDREGDNPLGGAHEDESWAFDAVWAVDVGERRKATPDELRALGASEAAAASGRCLVVQLAVWLPETSVGDLSAGETWTSSGG